MRLLGIFGLLVVVGLLSQEGQAHVGRVALTAGSWQAPTTIFSTSSADAPASVRGPTVALDRRGRATAVWLYSSLAEQVVMGADWTAAGGWSRARELAVGTDVFWPPALAVDARGDALIAWSAGNRVRAAYRPAGHAWQPPQTLSLQGELAHSPKVALDDRGRALVAWRGSQASHGTLEIAPRNEAGTWEKPKVICACFATFALAMNAHGLALLVWSPDGGGLWAQTRSPSGRWSKRDEISPVGTGLDYIPLALNARGAAVVAWQQRTAEAPEGSLTVAIRTPDGQFGGPQTVGGNPYWGFVVGLAPTGEAVVMWGPDGCCLLSMSRRPGASAFASQQLLAGGAGGQTVPGTVAMDAHGNALALWTRADEASGHLFIHAAQRPAGGSFGPGVDIGDVGEDSYKHSACSGQPSLATSANGNLGVAVWLTRPPNGGQCAEVEAATFNR